jgi:hypothetical protein
LVVVACGQVGHRDGVEIALSKVRSGDGRGDSGQGSSNGSELHFDGLNFDNFRGWQDSNLDTEFGWLAINGDYGGYFAALYIQRTFSFNDLYLSHFKKSSSYE